jgi:hypothetical protein
MGCREINISFSLARRLRPVHEYPALKKVAADMATVFKKKKDARQVKIAVSGGTP